MSPNGVGGGGGGVIERGTLLQKNDFQTGSLLERGGGVDYNFLMSTFGPM